MKKIVAILFLMISVYEVSAQRDSTSRINKKDEDELSDLSFIERCYWGGNGGAYFSNAGSYFDISPIMGYNVTPHFSLGISTTYKFYKYNYSGGSSNSAHVFGGGGFARLLLFDFLFAQAELEMLNTEVYDVVIKDYTRKFIPVGAAGLGFKSRTKGAYSYFMVLYDFVQDPWTPYYNTFPLVIKAGMVVPFK